MFWSSKLLPCLGWMQLGSVIGSVIVCMQLVTAIDAVTGCKTKVIYSSTHNQTDLLLGEFWLSVIWKILYEIDVHLAFELNLNKCKDA